MKYRPSIDAEMTSTPSDHQTVDAALLLNNQMEEHMPLVRATARQVHRSLPPYVQLEDLISAGTIGLIEAVQKFDRKSDTSFSAFAFLRIRGAMLDSLRKLDWAPRNLRREGRKIEEATAKCMGSFGRVPDQHEIAEELGTSLKELQDSLAKLNKATITPLLSGESEGEGEVQGRNESDDPGALVHCLRSELQTLLGKSIEALPDRERLVITLYYYEELNNGEVAKVMQLSEGQVSKYKASAMARLRGLLGEYAKGRVSF